MIIVLYDFKRYVEDLSDEFSIDRLDKKIQDMDEAINQLDECKKLCRIKKAELERLDWKRAVIVIKDNNFQGKIEYRVFLAGIIEGKFKKNGNDRVEEALYRKEFEGKDWNKAKKYAEELCKERGVKQHTFDRTSENKRYGNRFGKDTIYKKILELNSEEV